MRQFDIFANRSPRSQSRAPYLLVLPFRYFLDRRTTVIAPLIPEHLLTPVERLNPTFIVEERAVVLSPLELVAIPTSELAILVGNLESERDTIIAALDFLFTGV